MILFMEDWLKFPGAAPDYTTKNKTFLEYAKLLNTMGVRNSLWPLALIDQNLKGIDPHDPKLSLELIGRIAIECKLNPWYYFREVSKAPARAGGDPMDFKANRGNMAMLWLFFNHITLILVQIRQTGKSFSVDSLMRYLTNVRCTKTKINLLTKDDKLRSENLARLKEINDVLPYYFRAGDKDLSNTEEFKVSALNNHYLGHLPNRSPKLALNVGRGLTSPIFPIDEAAFIPNISISLPAALAGGTAVRDIAEINGEPYGTILTTTAGKKDDRDGKFIFTLLQNSAVWTEKLYDAKNRVDLEKTIRKANPSKKHELRVNCTFNHRQLGYTDAWLKRKIEDALAEDDIQAVERDFLNRWTSGTQLAPMTPDVAETIRDSEKEDPYVEITDEGYMVRWFVDKEDTETTMLENWHVMSVDTSDAAGDDDIAIHMRSVETGATIWSANINETNILTFTRWLFSWFVKYPKFVAIIERKSTGSSVVDILLDMMVSRGMNPFKRLYNRLVDESEEHKEDYNALLRSRDGGEFYITHKKSFGFPTSGSGKFSRKNLYGSNFKAACKNTGNVVHDTVTINQLLALEKNGERIDHPVGGHDDSVISWLLGYWFLTQGKNLQYYGINSSRILSAINRKSAESDPLAAYEYEEQERIREEIDILTDKLLATRDEFLQLRYEHRIRVLSERLKLTDGEDFSVDAFLEELRAYKRSGRR